MSRSLYLVCAIMLLMACGSGDVPVAAQDMGKAEFDAVSFTSDGGSAEANEAFRLVLQGACEKSFDCCSDSVARQLSGVSFRNDCASESIEPLATATIRGVTESANAGRVLVDSSAAGLCRVALLDTTCADWTTLDPLALDIPGCAEILTPQVDAGGDCSDDFECITGRCVNIGDRRVCATLASDGASCDHEQGIFCKEGSRCDNFEAFACVPLARDGELCVSDGDCVSRRCEGPDGEDNTCVAPGSVCEGNEL